MLNRVRDYSLILSGALIQALCMDLFLVPGRLAAGGVSGLAQIVNRYTGWPIGVMVIVANIPLFALGLRYLGGRRFLARTITAVIAYAILLDTLRLVLPSGLTPDPVLNSLYGGVLGGIGMGLVFRGQGTSGGTDILARLLGRWRGIPLSQSYLITDAAVVLFAGLAFSWELALYALVALYVSGVAAELAAEGRGIVRTATIISAKPEAIAEQILADLERGVTMWPGVGMYSGEERRILFCVVSRAEVNQLQAIIHGIDPAAFVVIGQAHEALGEGFRPLTKGA
ncbi:MAG: YitT family protein [Chloroflexi bacterium]|nr:YitT family protein [Chloroflexota bacterium]